MGDEALLRSWSVRDAEAAATRALAPLGLAGHGLEFLRLGENAIFRVADTGVVVRVARPGTDPQVVSQTMQAASMLRAAGVPVAEPAEQSLIQGPVVLPDGVVTAWVFYEQLPRETFDYADLGRLLELFHRFAPPVSAFLQPWQPLAMTIKRLQTLPKIGVPGEWTMLLHGIVEALQQDLAGFQGQLPVGVIHGDAHSGNALNTADGLVLVDLDNLAVGPREVDFVPTLVNDPPIA